MPMVYRLGLIFPTAHLTHGGRDNPLTVTEITTPSDVENKSLRYQVVMSPDDIGIYKVVFQVDGDFAPAGTYYVALEK